MIVIMKVVIKRWKLIFVIHVLRNLKCHVKGVPLERGSGVTNVPLLHPTAVLVKTVKKIQQSIFVNLAT